MTQKTALTRRSFLKAIGVAPVIGVSFIVPSCAPAKDPQSFLLHPAGLAPAQVDGNFCLRFALRVCARTIVLGPKAFTLCVAAWYAACIYAILNP